MDILIIGNGFDLAHDLETSYCNFLDFRNNQEFKDKRENFPLYDNCLRCNLWMQHFLNNKDNLNGDKWIDLEEEIFNVIKLLNNFSFERYFSDSSNYFIYMLGLNSLSFNFKNIRESIQREESTHYQLRQYINPEMVTKKGYSLILSKPYSDTFCVYIKDFKSFINFLYDQLREFTEAFQEYLIKYVLQGMKKEKYELVLKNNKQRRTDCRFYLLNFNYTNICQKLYGESEYQKGFKIETINLHGDINNIGNCNLVLGSKTFSDYGQNINPEYNVFQKHNQRHKYGTIELYQDFYLYGLSKTQTRINFHVVGHSLDETDKRLLKHIFDSKKDSIIYIYYHTEEAHQRLINNITNIISEDEVTARVRFIKQDDAQRGIFEEVSSGLTVSRTLM